MQSLDLSSGAAHFLSPAAAVENTVAALQKNETFYGEIAGLPTLKTAIKTHYQNWYQTRVPKENILITAGTKHALFTLFSVLLKPGDEVILPVPAWFTFFDIFHLLQVKVVALETKQEENYTIDPEKIKNLVTEKTRLFIFCNPANPTGRIYEKPEIESWLTILKNYPKIRVLSDEIYDLLALDKQAIPSLTRFPDPEEKHLVVNGFSKNFGMSGWRIGYIIAPEEIIKQCAHFQQTTISGVNPFIQEGAVAALQQLEDYLPDRIKVLTKNREILCNWLGKHPLISYYKPQGAYYIFADLRKLLQTEKLQKMSLTSTEKFCAFLEQELNILLQPGEKFRTPGFVRITFAVEEKVLREALQRLGNFLKN